MVMISIITMRCVLLWLSCKLRSSWSVFKKFVTLHRRPFKNKNKICLVHNSHVADTPQTTSVMIYIASVHRKRFVYIISLNQPKYTVDGQGSARPDHHSKICAIFCFTTVTLCFTWFTSSRSIILLCFHMYFYTKRLTIRNCNV